MRFIRLVVEAFRAIEHAEVHLGAGLNVLYGPNDLGKSTLAAALRAALLVRPDAAEATQFHSWFTDATPRVALSFVTGDDRYWTVRKGFGDGSTKAAELLSSKDGSSFVFECRGREVEERLRALLGWGIPAPGGKAGPRGVPITFLENALLAAQTDVDSILAASLATDPDPTGKIRLSKALATLAQDPLFKKVLDAAQREVEECFTRTGQRSRAQTSRFTKTANVIHTLQGELEDRQRRVADSAAIEERVRLLRERRDRAELGLAERAAALSAVRDRLKRSQDRQELAARLEAAKTALSEIDSEAATVGALDAEIERLAKQVKSREEDRTRTTRDLEIATAAVRDAQERLRVATSEGAARQRELLRSQLAEQAAVVGADRQAAENRKASLLAALQAIDAARRDRDAAASARTERDRFLARLEAARASLLAIDQELELARATLAYGRLRAALSAADEAAKAKKAAANGTREAEQKMAEAASFDEHARAMEVDLAARQRVLPTGDQATALAAMERQLEVAEAALGGGVSVVLRPRKAVTVQARVDDEGAVDPVDLAIERTLEAERSVHLSVADLVDIEVTAGAADQRRAVDKLRLRRKKELVPVLQRAGLNTLHDVATALGAMAKDHATAEAIRKKAADLRNDAAKLLERAEEQTEQAARLSSRADGLEARKAALGKTAPAVLEQRLAALGTHWEAPAEALHAKRSNEQRTAAAATRTAEQDAERAEYQVAEADRRTAERVARSEAALATAQSSDPGPLLARIERELESFGKREADIAAKRQALETAPNDDVDQAERAIAAAEHSLAAAKPAHDDAVQAVETSRAECNTRTGEANLRRLRLHGMDRAAAAALVEQRTREWAALPVEKNVSEADVVAAEQDAAAANRELDSAKEELYKSEGALTKVGGNTVREDLERIQEALTAEFARQREMETDADAWKLLRDTLRDVEDDEGAHLGRALAGPVSKKFEELTAGRYRDLRLDAALKTEALGLSESSATGADVLSALSVGTRHQLATLIRLTVAAQLKSAIVLDDHLVHTDPVRLAWFQDVLMKTALNTQVVVLTCRPEDYLTTDDLAGEGTERDIAGGAVRVIDGARVIQRWADVSSRSSRPLPVE
jgi:hypothetical protein